MSRNVERHYIKFVEDIWDLETGFRRKISGKNYFRKEILEIPFKLYRSLMNQDKSWKPDKFFFLTMAEIDLAKFMAG